MPPFPLLPPAHTDGSAFHICFLELSKHFSGRGFKHAFVFSDSTYAIRAAQAKSAPPTNVNLTRAARASLAAARLLFSVSIHWVRGHVAIGGNERVDLVAKRFARLSSALPKVLSPDFVYSSHVARERPWTNGFPLSGSPVPAFTAALSDFA